MANKATGEKKKEIFVILYTRQNVELQVRPRESLAPQNLTNFTVASDELYPHGCERKKRDGLSSLFWLSSIYPVTRESAEEVVSRARNDTLIYTL